MYTVIADKLEHLSYAVCTAGAEAVLDCNVVLAQTEERCRNDICFIREITAMFEILPLQRTSCIAWYMFSTSWLQMIHLSTVISASSMEITSGR